MARGLAYPVSTRSRRRFRPRTLNAHTDRRSGRHRIYKELTVDGVHFGKVFEVGQEHADADRVHQPGTGRLGNGGDVVERLAYLALEKSGGTALVAGTPVAPVPETKSRPPETTPCEYAPNGMGAASVRTALRTSPRLTKASSSRQPALTPGCGTIVAGGWL